MLWKTVIFILCRVLLYFAIICAILLLFAFNPMALLVGLAFALLFLVTMCFAYISRKISKEPTWWAKCRQIYKWCFVFIIFGGIAIPFISGLFLRNRIISEIPTAASIRVVEHSHWVDDRRDFYNRKLSRKDWNETIYSSVVLASDEISRLRQAFPPSLDTRFGPQNYCDFIPHHRIEITRHDGSKFVVHVCFKCDDMAINKEGKFLLPIFWGSSLREFISSLSMHPDNGPWKIVRGQN